MKKFTAITMLLVFLTVISAQEALARAGGGKSGGMGSRGSRTYSAPSKPAQSPSSPSQVQRQQQALPSSPASQPSRWGGFMGMMAGGILGGLIGNMLFSSFAHGAGPGGYGGPGLFDIILIGIVIFIIYKFIAARRKAQQPAYSGAYHQYSGLNNQPQGQIPAYDQGGVYDGSASTQDNLLRGISHIRQLDSSFDERRFKEVATDIFFKVQAAWMGRSMEPVRGYLTQEMYNLMSQDVEKMKVERRINRLENIALRNIEITEAWQEEGRDYITLEINANVLDYVTDEAGRVIEGSNTDPVRFVEYWTFTRAAGPNNWQLSAIQQA